MGELWNQPGEFMLYSLGTSVYFCPGFLRFLKRDSWIFLEILMRFFKMLTGRWIHSDRPWNLRVFYSWIFKVFEKECVNILGDSYEVLLNAYWSVNSLGSSSFTPLPPGVLRKESIKHPEQSRVSSTWRYIKMFKHDYHLKEIFSIILSCREISHSQLVPSCSHRQKFSKLD